jgi:UDP-N-acetylglucosamine 2-epimerase (non-hydrolysing)
VTLPTVVLVAGARPNFMKVAPILRAWSAGAPGLRPVLVHTGQHYDAAMSDVFFEELGIPAPEVHLAVGAGSHGAQTARILEAFEAYLQGLAAPPRGVVVVGDVNSTMACTLAATKLGVPVAHVEAGLRSFDRAMPEEINRLVTDAVADLLLTSEPAGAVNLGREGVDPGRVVFVGNVMIDTLVQQLDAARAPGHARAAGGSRPDGTRWSRCTGPPTWTTPARLAALVDFLRTAAATTPVVFPLHPRTRGRLEATGLYKRLDEAPGVTLLGPLSYRENLGLMAEARLVLTDSGGIQEESSYLGVPCLTLRRNTERPVTVTQGTNTLVGDDLDAARRGLNDIEAGRYKAGQTIEGWDGHAAVRVVAALNERWS